ncbi:MAG: DUF5615 family PIN-like protein [Chitinophagaceae bacterium]|jgi:predicted nuclease of predicted toxin-antitoxin system|nr:DUF5615 family PIN-like protein [Chitinophagaceae bacterium]
MRFLVDANIPIGIPELSDNQFLYVYNWNENASDSEIWNYALENDLIIITRDSDFYYRYITSKHFPKVIFLQLQQLSKQGIKDFFSKNWIEISLLIEKADMLIVDLERIQLINK